MAIFNTKQDAGSESVPPQRVAGFANLDLNKCLEAKPYPLGQADDVDWDIAYNDDGTITASGVVKVPVSIVFNLGDLDNATTADDLVVSQITVDGKKVVASHLKQANIPFDPLATVDTVRAEGEARRQYRDAIQS